MIENHVPLRTIPDFCCSLDEDVVRSILSEVRPSPTGNAIWVISGMTIEINLETSRFGGPIDINVPGKRYKHRISVWLNFIAVISWRSDNSLLRAVYPRTEQEFQDAVRAIKLDS